MMPLYGIYSNNLERFVYTSTDLWLLMHSAKLLSGKMTLCVININDNNIDRDNCIQYSLLNSTKAKQNVQIPQLVLDSEGEQYQGKPLDIDADLFLKQIKFIRYLIKVVNSTWLTDAQLNVSDHNLLLSLLGSNNLRKVNDDCGIKQGFKFSMDQILYTSNTIDEIKQRISNLFDYANSERPTNMKIYESTFRKYMKNG